MSTDHCCRNCSCFPCACGSNLYISDSNWKEIGNSDIIHDAGPEIFVHDSERGVRKFKKKRGYPEIESQYDKFNPQQ